MAKGRNLLKKKRAREQKILAKKAKKVIGVEIVPQAIENAKENAILSGIDNAEFYCGDCTEVVTGLVEKGEKADFRKVIFPVFHRV